MAAHGVYPRRRLFFAGPVLSGNRQRRTSGFFNFLLGINTLDDESEEDTVVDVSSSMTMGWLVGVTNEIMLTLSSFRYKGF
jgi:hypothetical protein